MRDSPFLLFSNRAPEVCTTISIARLNQPCEGHSPADPLGLLSVQIVSPSQESYAANPLPECAPFAAAW
jgi:hypothetical protein